MTYHQEIRMRVSTLKSVEMERYKGMRLEEGQGPLGVLSWLCMLLRCRRGILSSIFKG